MTGMLTPASGRPFRCEAAPGALDPVPARGPGHPGLVCSHSGRRPFPARPARNRREGPPCSRADPGWEWRLRSGRERRFNGKLDSAPHQGLDAEDLGHGKPSSTRFQTRVTGTQVEYVDGSVLAQSRRHRVVGDMLAQGDLDGLLDLVLQHYAIPIVVGTQVFRLANLGAGGGFATPARGWDRNATCAAGWAAYAEKLAAGGDSIVARLCPQELLDGLATLRVHAAVEEGDAIVEPIDLMVFR